MSRRKQPLPKCWESSMRCFPELKTRPRPTKSFQADRAPRVARLGSRERQSLGHHKESQLIPASSETATPKVLSTRASLPYPVSTAQRSTGFSAPHRSESASGRLQPNFDHRAQGLPASTRVVTRALTWLFQGTKIRAVRGSCPLNSNRCA